MSNPFLPQQQQQQPQQQPPQQPQQQQQPTYPQQPAPMPQQQPNPAPAQQYAPAPTAPANPYAQQPQQQYAAPAPQQYTQQQPQQYTQQPQQYPSQNGAAPAGPVPVAAPGQFLTPPPPSEGGSANMPRIQDLQGRLLIVMPERVEHGVPGKFGVQDRMTCTVVVLDGGPIVWGGTTPGSQRQQQNVPYAVKGLWIRQTKLIEQLTEALNVRQAGGPGLALGRLWKTGPSNNDPYVLAAPNEQDAALYSRYGSTTNPFAL